MFVSKSQSNITKEQLLTNVCIIFWASFISPFSPGSVVYTSKFLLTLIPAGFPLLRLSIQEKAKIEKTEEIVGELKELVKEKAQELAGQMVEAENEDLKEKSEESSEEENEEENKEEKPKNK